MLGLWMYSWEETDWSGASSSTDEFFGLLLALRWEGSEEEAAVEEVLAAGRSNAGGGDRRNNYTGPDPEFWEVREKYLKQYTKVIEAAKDIAKSNFPAQETHDNLSGNRAGGVLPDPLQPLLRELARALLTTHTSPDLGQVDAAMGEMQRLVLDIRKTKQQYYDRAISILLLDVF